MKIPIILAHGALGGFDEVIFIGVAIVFIVMMGASWIKSRSMEPLLDEDEPEPNSDKPSESTSTSNNDHSQLD
jgi:hypothetical protein